MRKSRDYDVRIFLCDQNLLVLHGSPNDMLLLQVSSQPEAARVLRSPLAVALVHRSDSTTTKEDVIEKLRTRQCIKKSELASRSGWLILRRHVPIDDEKSWLHVVDRSVSNILTLSGHQPAYHPYTGYLAKIATSDIFTVAADMRFGRQTFQHRQRIEDAAGKPRWLTVPLHRSPHGRESTIAEKEILQEDPWSSQHWRMLQERYQSWIYFNIYAPMLEQLYSASWSTLLSLTDAITRWTADCLGLETTTITTCSLYRYSELRRGRRIAAEIHDLLQEIGAESGRYLTGAAGAEYLLEATLDGKQREIDHILKANVDVVKCSFSSNLMADMELPVGEPGIGLLCKAGPAAGDILLQGIKLQHIESRTM